jgi:voltage-gated potassium channel
MIGFFYAITHFFITLKRLLRDKEFKGLFGLVIILLVLGTLFYSQVEGWSFVDSLYFSATTLTTVGLGDLHPVTVSGKLFTIIYIFSGIGVILAFINALAHHTNRENPITKILHNFGDRKH